MTFAEGELPPPPTVDTEHPYTTVYTDGSSTGRVGPGGWARVTTEGLSDVGAEHNTTNQRMELVAAHRAMLALPGLLLVVSDSEYVVKGASEWVSRWARARWRRVANADLWEPFYTDLLERRGQVRFAWVKGHAGYEFNDAADELARAARLQLTACRHCGQQMKRGGTIIACGSACSIVEAPYSCASAECQQQRDEAAMADAIARGVITA